MSKKIFIKPSAKKPADSRPPPVPQTFERGPYESSLNQADSYISQDYPEGYTEGYPEGYQDSYDPQSGYPQNYYSQGHDGTQTLPPPQLYPPSSSDPPNISYQNYDYNNISQANPHSSSLPPTLNQNNVYQNYPYSTEYPSQSNPPLLSNQSPPQFTPLSTMPSQIVPPPLFPPPPQLPNSSSSESYLPPLSVPPPGFHNSNLSGSYLPPPSFPPPPKFPQSTPSESFAPPLISTNSNYITPPHLLSGPGSTNPTPSIYTQSFVPSILLNNPEYSDPSVSNPEPLYATPSFDVDTIICELCQLTGVQLILPECKHTFHFKCFKENAYVCIACNIERKIDGLETKDPSLCFVCQSSSNLIMCETCFKQYCFICISNKKIEGCCGNIENNLKKFNVKCPGCEYETSYDNMMSTKCKDHDLLCKKCWNLGVATQQCIMGCKISWNMGIYCKCSHCDKNEIKYLSELQCPDCTICDFCQRSYLMQGDDGEDLESKCAHCGNDLIEVMSRGSLE